MAARLLFALIFSLALVGGGYWWGSNATDNAWQAKHAKALEAERAETAKETKRADQAAANYLTEHLDQEDRYAALNATYQDLRRRVPLVVPGPVVVVTRSESPGPDSPGPDERSAPATAVDSSPVLTLAAVRMWNGALIGTDQATGACGPAGATEGSDAACAQGSGLTLNDAWANHAANAKACAADRQRYQHLIDYLNGK
ncbi:hypothetical protein ACOYR4_18560 [Acidovorax sp. M14]|uniref:hypothetical protein n=1 Tax=Acidovorax sp. M14 TaxID=3411354 RepID=UPI003BF52AF1